jgi:hypothetical protein
VYANVLSESFEPVELPRYAVTVEAESSGRRVEQLQLKMAPGTPGLYQGFFNPAQGGGYRIVVPAVDRSAANAAAFHVQETALEASEPAMQEALLRKMAEVSGGRYFPIRELAQLPKSVGGSEQTTVIRRNKELWDLPPVFTILLALAGTEWYLRRRHNLV